MAKVNEECYFTLIDEKSIVLNTSTDIYYELDDKATYIWNCFVNNVPKNQIIEQYQVEFNKNKEESKQAIESFISDAMSQGLIE